MSKQILLIRAFSFLYDMNYSIDSSNIMLRKEIA